MNRPLPQIPSDQADEPPPILGSWRKVYWLVLAHLAFWILVFYGFTLRFGVF